MIPLANADLFGSFQGYGWAALAILVIAGFGLWVLGRKIGLRQPIDWFPFWAFALGISIASIHKSSSLAGYLVIISFIGFFVNVWLMVRQRLPTWIDSR